MFKKIINNPDHVVSELIEGFIAANRKIYEPIDGVTGVLYRYRRKGKVTLVIGGGSGHEPMFAGFVGQGLADAAACGNVFTSPDPGTIYTVTSAAHGGNGVLFLYGNYAGDNLNFDMAEALLADDGIAVMHIRVNDDCASAPANRKEDRRGIAGDLFALKIAGAACDAGHSLHEVHAIVSHTLDRLRSVGLATSPCLIPGNTGTTFTLGDDEIEYGMGIHGEPGIARQRKTCADELTDYLFEKLIDDMPLPPKSEVCVLVNGLGSTPLMEQYIVYRRLQQRLDEKDISVYDVQIGNFCTSMEMGGFSISILLLDDTLKTYYDAHCASPGYTRCQ